MNSNPRRIQMIDPKDATKIVTQGIKKASKEDIERTVNDSNIILFGKSLAGSSGYQLDLFRPSDSPLPLNAYLASALTGLKDDERDLVFLLSDTVSLVCKKHGIELYEPRKNTDPVHHADVEDTAVFNMDRQRVLDSDLLIYLGHFASTGAGQELDFAYSAMLPIIIISRNGDKVSRMVTGIPSLKVEIKYETPEELRESLEDCLNKILPIIEARKLAFSEYKTNIVGQRISTLRMQQGLTRENVAAMVSTLTVDGLKLLEESTDHVSNPSLSVLRQVAVVLKTTVAELVEPDLGSSLVSYLNERFIDERMAARYSNPNEEDRKKIMIRILSRLIEDLTK